MNSGAVDILSKVHKDGFALSVFAIFDIMLIAFMFSLLSSKYILAPGISMRLDGEMALPASSGDAIGGVFARDSVSVLNIRGKGMVMFEGEIFSEETFSRAMKNYKPRGEILLIKADAAVSGQTLLNICSIAKSAGFKEVQIAARQAHSK